MPQYTPPPPPILTTDPGPDGTQRCCHGFSNLVHHVFAGMTGHAAGVSDERCGSFNFRSGANVTSNLGSVSFPMTRTASRLPRLLHSGDYCLLRHLATSIYQSLTLPTSVLLVPDFCLKEPETSLKLSSTLLRHSIPRGIKALFLGFEYCLRSSSEDATVWETVLAEARELVDCLARQIESIHVCNYS